MSTDNLICAVIVTYNPVIDDLVNTISTLKKQNCDVIIVDNSASQFELDENLKIKYLWLGGNKGIATAQNKGIEYSLSKKYKYTIFFDQDSKIPEAFVSTMLNYAEENEFPVSAPVFYDEKRGFEYAITHVNKNGTRKKLFSNGSPKPFKSSVVISSGTLVRNSLIEEIGPMDDGLFIDYVDTEWCLRSFAKGYLVAINPSAVMLHSIGNSSFSLFGFCVPVHSASRRYYRVRNSFKLLHYPHVPKLLAIREIIFSTIHSFLLIIHEQDRGNYFKTFINGVWDGMRNINGENPRTLKNSDEKN